LFEAKNSDKSLTFIYGVYDMKIFILFLVLTSLTIAQTEDPLKYFPYKTGNMWEYYFDDLEYPDTVQVFNIKDSVDSDGNIYVRQFARRINPIQYPLLFPDTATYIIDTSFNVWAPPSIYGSPLTENFIMYKLNAKKGDQWIIYDYASGIGGNGYEIARLREVWEDELFFGSGITTIFKRFIYYYSIDSTDTLGLVRYGDILSYGFGLWSRGGGDLIGNILLKGCVINDTLYGDTTNLITSIKDLSEKLPVQFELFQNYPNPFNPTTTIKYSVAEPGIVSLKVFDILGREVATLVNERKPAGYYEVSFDGSELSSGIYFYQLTAGVFKATKKFVLLK